MKTEKNILVYVKTKDSKTFKALASLKTFTFAPTLMYAAIFPYEKLSRLKEWSNQFKDLCIKENVKIELRHYKGKAIHSVG